MADLYYSNASVTFNATPIVNTTMGTASTILCQPARGIPESTRRLAFNDFHAEHPEIYESIRSLALVSGDERVSVRRLVERLRLGSNLKINNNHIRFYAEKLKEDYPQQAHLFKTRKS